MVGCRAHVIVLSTPADAHAELIGTRLRNRFAAEVTVWDTSGVPARQTLSIASHRDTYLLGSVGPVPFDLGSATSCWWRRPMASSIPDEVGEPRVRQYCRLESDRLTRGALLAARIPLVNDPVRQSAADHKPLQLRTAREVGLRIPDTLITNDPDAALRFVDSLSGRCIFKAFHSPSWRIVETREFDESMQADLRTLRFAPVIFQEYVPLGRDIRVIAMGHAAFAAAASHRSAEAYLDWRLDTSVRWEPFDLPDRLTVQIAALLDRLGLSYGSIDLRETPDGECVFLEINPSGQFLFLEQEDGHTIADAFCELLMTGGCHSGTSAMNVNDPISPA